MGQNGAATHSNESFGRNLMDAHHFDRCAMPQIQQTRGDHPLRRSTYGLTGVRVTEPRMRHDA
jgi:hypothetical protein